MTGNDKGPSPLVPSIMLGVFGLFKYGPSLVSYLSFAVEILEGLTGGGNGDEEGAEGDGENEGEGGSFSSILTTLCYLCALAIILLALLLLLQETNRLYRRICPEVPWRLSSGPLADGICWGILLLVVLFIVMYNDLI